MYWRQNGIFFPRENPSNSRGKRVVLTLLDAVLALGIVVGGVRDPLDAFVIVVLGRGALLRICAFYNVMIAKKSA